MSTSCIIALYSKIDDEIVLLEKTHDGFLEKVKSLINEAINKGYIDLEEIIEYLLKNTDVRFSIYSHKYPHNAFIYFVDTNKYKTVKINPDINKISEILKDIQKVIKESELYVIS